MPSPCSNCCNRPVLTHPHRDLVRFTDFAVQIRYDQQPDLQNLDRSNWNSRAEALVAFFETLLPPPASSWL